MWITRLSAACRARGLRYSEFIFGLKHAGIELDRKTLSELAIHEPAVFDEVFAKAKGRDPGRGVGPHRGPSPNRVRCGSSEAWSAQRNPR